MDSKTIESKLISNSTALLLGAGFSIPFGIPSTEKLTELITSEKIKFVRATWGDYYTEEKWREDGFYRSDLDFPKAEAYHNIIRFLYKKEQAIESKLVRKINFEDIYSLLYSLGHPSRNACNHRYLEDFIEHLDKLNDAEKTKLKIPYPGQNLLNGLIRQPDTYFKAMKMLKCIIAKELEKHNGVDVTLLKSKFWDHLFKSEKINIFSLNHDLIIEQILGHKSKDFQDGFELKNGFQEFTDNFPDNNKINFLKLHGSIDWFNVNYSGRNFYVNNKDAQIESMIKRYSEGSQELLLINDRAFLTGTQNKYEEYLMSIYSDLKWHYKRLLKDTEKLIVIGYSFGDYGVNTEIINWMDKKNDAKLIIIDPKAKTLLKTGFLMPRLKKKFPERITAINKGFEDLREADYKSIFSI
ncbi:MAG: SIR2 family protein [Cyanobacteria bacterium REEB446]|nr:SIR2 family protein [Cyanobacteria bacterium REEB446]